MGKYGTWVDYYFWDAYFYTDDELLVQLFVMMKNLDWNGDTVYCMDLIIHK